MKLDSRIEIDWFDPFAEKHDNEGFWSVIGT